MLLVCGAFLPGFLRRAGTRLRLRDAGDTWSFGLFAGIRALPSRFKRRLCGAAPTFLCRRKEKAKESG
jgi:hypothetical protein